MMRHSSITSDHKTTRASKGGAVNSDIFRPVTSERLSVDIVDQIKSAISERRLGPGDKLPSERELTERFSVSRVSVRDALRILETTGLVEIRVGARGGAFVTSPAPRLVGEGFTNMLLLSVVTPAQVTEARVVFEVGMIPLICERATEEDIADLRSMCEAAKRAMADNSHTMQMSADFHVRLARAAHNAAIELIVESFQGPLIMSLMKAKEAAPQMGRRGVKEHLEIVEAIALRDAAAATEIMTRHLSRTVRRLAGQGARNKTAASGSR